MTAVLDATPPAREPVPGAALATWSSRAGAVVVDVLPGLGVLATLALLALTAPADGWTRWMFTGAAGVTLFLMAGNRLVLPGATGWTMGRALFGIRVVGRDGGSVGLLRLAVRELAHLVDTAALFVGWLWPLWDGRRRTFADLLVRTEVRCAATPQRDVRRVVAKVLVAAAVVGAAAAGLGYAAVYRHERAVDSARQQVAEQGPRIVEQMLSYGSDTMQQDFARAQSLTTDTYRPQLIAQQQAVQDSRQKGETNEYWAVNSAVLTDPPVTPDRVAMLLAMQGQRGANPADMKFITATVRVDFERAPDDRWQVANLTVLKKPQMNVAGQ